MASIVFRVAAGPKIGFGHLARTMVLAEALRNHGTAVHFCIPGAGDGVLSLLDENRFMASVSTDVLPKKWLSETRADAVVYDLVHTDWQAEQDRLFAEMTDVCKAAVPIVFFDGYGQKNYRRQIGAPLVDFIVAPYVGETGPCPTHALSVLTGPRYFPLARNYQDVGRRGTQSMVLRILVTCGGADPYMASPKILEALLSMPESDIEIDVVVGVLFSNENRQQIEALAARAPDRVHPVYAPHSLVVQMQNADLCVTANGLTKYELAAMGVPTIAVSLSPAHHQANLAFAESGSLKVLGILSDLDGATIADAVSKMVEDADGRRRMSHAGISLVDGQGADRVLKEAKLLPC